MSEITIPKQEYDLLNDFYRNAKKQFASARLLESIRESRLRKPRALSRAQFKKKFGI